MSGTTRGIICLIIISIWTFFICKSIENKKLKKQINILYLLLLIWIILRIIKYDFLTDDKLMRLFWYLYYFPELFSATTFFFIGTWHNKNKKYIKSLKMISLVVSSILFLLVLTNDFHGLAFKIDFNSPDWEKTYTYGIVYYLCLIWIFINVAISIISAVKYSKGLYKKQKIIILTLMFFLVLSYAFGYMFKNPFVYTYLRDFILVYSIVYMLALIIVVYKEKYRMTLEENLYNEIEKAIKNKTILINKIINNISNSKNKKRDLTYVKLLISYCKNKSNLIVIQKNKECYTWEELKLFINTALKDASSLGINGAVNIVNKFEIPIYTTSIIYDYIYNLFEYSNKYDNTNILISIQKVLNYININTMINTMINTNEDLLSFEYNSEINELMKIGKIIVNQSEEENLLNISLKIPVDIIIVKESNLTEKEKSALLEIKSKVHDILGQRLSVISKIVEDDIEENRIDEIKPLLKNILNDVDNDKLINPKELLNQIIYTCELAGTKLYVSGELPKNYIKAITLVKIIRECSTNAIRHAKAQNVYISITEKDKIEMIISNDGNKVNTFNEGDGIKGIKNRLEELNGNIEINTDNEFTVKVSL